jgi:predicted RNase H-like nuclease (RuvC/YqgF family)
MFRIIKGITKTAVYSLLAVTAIAGGTYLIAGPGRATAMAHQFKDRVSQVIDTNLDDPTALRRQLVTIEKEYPERIAEVRLDLADLRGDIANLEEELAVSDRVVVLAGEDLAQLRSQVSGAQLTSFSGSTLRAQVNRQDSRERSLEQIILANQGRAVDAVQDLEVLKGQEQRLDGMVQQLESERAQFQVQLSQLERQVDSIARNDRMISLMEKRNRTIEKMRSWDAVSLDQISSHITKIRTRQEARLDVLTQDENHVNYEDLAREELRAGRLSGASEGSLMVLRAEGH